MATNGDVASEGHTEDYQKLIDYGIHAKVSNELDNIYKAGILAHSDLDERALDALKEFPTEGGVSVLKEFRESNLEHVSNKSAYLCGVMKTYRQKNKMHGNSGDASGKKPGPDEAKLKEILDRTKYDLDVTVGQRKYGGPPPSMEASSQPGAGHEVFCGKIPKDIFEDELIPLFEKCGQIWDLRLMMDPMSGLNRGYCFVTFVEKDGAQEAVKQLDNYEIKPTKRLKVNVSVANVRLFVGNIPKSKSKEEIEEEFQKLTDHLTDVIIYSSPDDTKKKNRGFAFLEYTTHKDASMAKRRIGNGRTRVWGCDIIVDWADPQEEPDDETMAKVKVLYVRNLKSDITEEDIKAKFEPFGKIDRVKKIKDYGFVHYEDRDDAVKAMNALNGQKLGESEIEISLAKPPSENKQNKKMKRQEHQRMLMLMQRGQRGFEDPGWYGEAPQGRMRGGRGRPGYFNYYEDPYEYHGGYSGDYFDYSYYPQDDFQMGFRNSRYQGGGRYYSSMDSWGGYRNSGQMGGRPRGRPSQRGQRR